MTDRDVVDEHPGFPCDCGAHFDDILPLHRHQESECTNPYSVLHVVSCWRGFNYMPVKMRQAIHRALNAQSTDRRSSPDRGAIERLLDEEIAKRERAMQATRSAQDSSAYWFCGAYDGLIAFRDAIRSLSSPPGRKG